MRVNNVLKVSNKWRRRDLNLRPTDTETDIQPPRLTPMDQDVLMQDREVCVLAKVYSYSLLFVVLV